MDQSGKPTGYGRHVPDRAAAAGATSPTNTVCQTAHPATEGSETVLVVEDQDEVRKLALAVLKKFGYQTLEARSGT